MTTQADPPVDRRAVPEASPSVVRTDIQGLRAGAVSLVLLFHLWPHRLTGGFVGVDAFFVISGFLITSHLLAHPPSRPRDLAVFWARRIQRLLPASLLVLATTTVATLLVAPATVWADTAASVRAAALYVVNWRLASTSVDYLAAQAKPSPVQHYWSLSIEEQFYLIWPVLILALAWAGVRVARRRALGGVERRPDRGSPAVVWVVGGLVLVVATSLAWSILATAQEPAAAYFVTPTRIWELGVGGVLAATLSRRAFGRNVDHEHVALPPAVRTGAAWAGLAAVAWSAVAFSSSTPFPGSWALVPVLGVALVIAVDTPAGRWSPRSLLDLRPVQYLGDISYSVYLWHWPLIVLVPYVTRHGLTLPDKALIIVVTLVLAGVTKRYVEDPLRDARWRRPLFRPYVAMVVGMALVIALAAGLAYADQRGRHQARDLLAEARAQAGACFGAAALDDRPKPCPRTTAGPTVPAPAQAVRDKSDAYRDHCWEWIPFDGMRTCSYGDEHSDVSIALIGNSHAGEWLPALQEVAKERGWHITTILASECAATRARVVWDTEEKAQGCLDWGQRVLDYTAKHDFDLVVTSERTGRDAADTGNPDALTQGYAAYLREWVDQGQRVAVIHDTPFPSATHVNPPECIAEHPDDLTPCSGSRAAWVPPDELVDAARPLAGHGVSVIDMTDHICGPETCDAAVGRVTAYFDGSHISATFSATLAPYLGRALAPLVAHSRH